jgi:hypothetical protein
LLADHKLAGNPPLATVLEHMHDPADDAANIPLSLAAGVCWQMRLYLLPLLIAQPKQIPAHAREPKKNR